MKTIFYTLLSGITFILNAHFVHAQGTYPVFPNILDHPLSDDVRFLGAFDHRLVYTDIVSNQVNLFVSDGTPQGTIRISSAAQTEVSLVHKGDEEWYFTERKAGQYYISKLIAGVDTLVPVHKSGIRYSGTQYWNGKFTWIQESVGSGYSRLQLFDPVADTLITLANLSYPKLRGIGSSDSFIYYIAALEDGTKMLGKSDGTPSGTSLFSELLGPGNSFDRETRFFSNGSQVYFFYHPNNDPFILWTTDGTDAGTLQLGEYQSPFFGWVENPAIFLGNKFFFILQEYDAPGGTTDELHVSDGTPGGTLTLDNEPDDYLQPQDLTEYNGKIYFTSRITDGSDLSVTDGTIAGTQIIIDPFGHWDGGIGAVGALGSYNGTLVLQALSDDLGSELYTSNGTSNGTVLLADVIRGNASSDASRFVQVDELLFFSVFYANRNRLWVYDPAFAISCDSFNLDSSIITHVTDSALGSIQVIPFGGQQPFEFSINGGTETSNAIFNDLSLGEHTIEVTDNLGCITEMTFLIEEATWISDPELLRELYVSPNPAKSNEGITLNLSVHHFASLQNISIIIYSPDGRQMLKEKVQLLSNTFQHPVQTKNFAPGQYILSVLVDGNRAGHASFIIR